MSEVIRRARPGRPLLRGGLALAMLTAAAAPATEPVEPAKISAGSHLAQRGLEVWTQEAGLAGSWVRDIVQGPDGFLWIATSGGLSRFDGRRFVNFNAMTEPEMPGNSATALASGLGGRLWIGFEHGGVRWFGNGHMRRDERLDGLPPALVRSLVETADGTLWIGTAAGLWRWRSGDGLANLAPDAAGRGASIYRILVESDGTLRVRTREHGLWRVHADAVSAEVDAPGCVGLDFARVPGGLEITSCVSGIWQRRQAETAWREIAPAMRVQRLLVDREGSLWYGDDEALVRRSAAGVERLDVAAGLGDSRTRAFFEDERGDVWVGTFSRGLARLRDGAVAAFGLPEGLPIRGTTAVVGRSDGTMWLGSVDNGVYLWSPDAGVLRHWTVADGLPSDKVQAIAQDPSRADHVWFGTDRGLVEIRGNSLRQVERPGPSPAAGVATLFADPLAAGTLWVSGDSGGAEELRAGAATRHDRANGLELKVVRFFHRNRQGVLLAGGAEGLFRYDGAGWHRVELGGAGVRELHAVAEQEDGALWYASDSAGLLRWADGRLTRMDEREGLPFNDVFSVTLDGVGGLWLSGNEGLARLRVADFERWSRGALDSVPTELFSARDGLRDRECNGWGHPAASQLPDGTLAFPTLNGVALVNPRRVAQPQLGAGDILVDAVWTGERELDLALPLYLSAQERQLRLRFTALEFLRPESLSYRYRLEGADSDWAPSGQQRVAVYSHLDPGSYRFRLQARLPGREWVEASPALAVVVAPRLVEAGWFRALAFSCVLAGLAALFQWRVRKEHELRASQRELRALASRLIRAQEDERRRLAREIHDDLTQRLAGLGMVAGGLARAVTQGRAENVGSRVEELGRELERLASDAQIMARDLHPSLLENLGLEAAVKSECATFGERTGLQVQFSGREVPPDLRPDVSLALYRIAQEALRNVLNHAGVREARVLLAGRDSELALVVEDAGAGFDPEGWRGREGMGLASMAERARFVGADFELDSAPGRGTRIVVRVALDATGLGPRRVPGGT